jgi:hypothetical protein
MSENFLGSFRNGEEIRLEAGQVLFKKGCRSPDLCPLRVMRVMSTRLRAMNARATEMDQG